MNSKAGIAVFLALVAFDGAIRKWLLPQWEQVIYFAKDILLFAMLAWYLARTGPRMPRGVSGTPLVSWLALYVGIVALQTLNPTLPSFALGLLGLKSHVLYAALLVLVPAAFRDTEDLARTIQYMLVPVFVILIFGIVQFYLPPDHPLNRYVRGTPLDIATFGIARRVRVTSTFSYISGMTVFIYFALCLGLAFLSAGRWRLRGNLLAYACVVTAVIVTPMTGARWIYYMVIATAPLFLFGMIRAGMLQTRFAWRILVLASLGILAVSLWSMEAFESLEHRRQSSLDAAERFEGMVSDPLEYGLEAGFLGFGAGATHQAAPTLVRETGLYTWIPVSGFEDEPGRVMLELGILGFVIAFGLRLYLCHLAWRAMIAGATRIEKGLAAGAFIFFVAHVVSPIVFNAVAGALYWLFVGIVATILRDQHLRRVALPEMPPGALMIRLPRALT